MSAVADKETRRIFKWKPQNMIRRLTEVGVPEASNFFFKEMRMDQFFEMKSNILEKYYF
jgi:hypothetical protein